MADTPEVPAEVLDAATLAYNERARDLREHGPDTLLAAVQVAYTAGRDSARAEVAAKLRAAFIAGAQIPEWATPGGVPVASRIAEWAARIAEGRADG